MEAQPTERLAADLHEGVARLARRLRRKRSDGIRMTIQQYLDKAERMPRPGPHEPIQDRLGALHDGVTDLGSRHREHLLARDPRRT